MGDVDYCCFIGGLSWSTTDNALKDAFKKFSHLIDAKVIIDRFSGRSRGFGFVTFDEKGAMEDAIDEMNGRSLDGRSITVSRAQTQGSGRDRGGGRDYDRDRDYDRGGRSFGGGRASGGDCFKCGKPDHFARDCPGDGSSGDRYGGRDDRYGGGGGGSRRGSERGGDRYGGHNRDDGHRAGSGSDRHNRDRSGPYERPSSGSHRS